MKMFKKKAMTSFVAVVAAALFVASGCSSEDDPVGDGDGDATGGTSSTGGSTGTGGTTGPGGASGDGLGSCEDLCDAAVEKECGTEEACIEECEALEFACPSEMVDYLECGEDESVVICEEGISFAIITACIEEVQAVGECAEAFGGGGAGGNGGAGGDTQ